ncbi:MAG: tetratricopeptide repeat protein [Ekhidna sp.]
MRKYLLLFFGFSFYLSFGQSSIPGGQYADLSAFESFQVRKYKSVVGKLSAKKNKTEDEEILLLLSELKTGNGEAGKVEGWLVENPKHPIKPLVNYHLGEYYFYERDTLKSKKYLMAVNSGDLTKRDKASYGFVFGLLKLDEENYKDANNLFQFSRKNEFEESFKLDYYEGFSEYHLGNSEAALDKLTKVENSEEFSNSSKFFIAKIRLENGEMDEVIEMAQNELSDEKTITNSGFHQLIGEAYALKDQEAKADAFFERAIELHPFKPSAALYYQAGVSKFKIGNEDLAIDFLTQAGIQGGEYAQLSALQLARLYLKKQAFEKSLTAYIEASASSNNAIKEESFYQASKINAKLGFFTEAINYATDYLNQFKDSSKRESMQNLIAQSYLRTSNYDLAIDHLNSTGIINDTQKEVYQKVTYQKAVLMFNDVNFSEADKWFRESLRFTPDTDRTLSNGAYFHLAEIAMKSNQFDLAINYYTKQATIEPASHYGIGYARYNKQQYQDAIPHFRKALQIANSEMQLDANVRLADCLYATKSYQEAFTIYDKLTLETSSAYVTFQKAMSLKSLGNESEATRTFSSLFSDKRYGAQAQFQSGMIQFESAKFPEAASFFSNVITEHPNSSLVVEALLNRGISKKNMDDLAGASEDYKAILDNHIDSEIALNAILGMQELQQAGLSIRNLDKYIAQYKKVNPEDGSLELIEFESAKRLYFDFSYAEAAAAFEKYIKDYPESSNKIEAKYYQADSYYRTDELASARPLFNELKFVRNPLTGRILNRLGEINKRLDFTEEAEEAYKLLSDLNLSPKDGYNARQGLMLLYLDLKRHNDAITYADEIIAADWKPLNAEQEAIVVKARSWFQLKDFVQATDNFKRLAEIKDEKGAEANYFLGLMAFQESEYEKSLDILFLLNSDYGSYTQWVDESYLLIARNYIEMDELFQAKATLRSIIQHSKNEDVKVKSQTLLDQIEQTSLEGDSTQIKD